MLLRGTRFCIKGAWDDTPTPDGRLEILLNPAPQVFGIGTHISTQIFLDVLEKTVKPGFTVVDYGAGTGILSIAAARLGAPKVYAAEVREDALLAARANVVSNGMTDVIVVGTEVPPDVEAEVDLVVCNIDTFEAILEVLRKAEIWLKPAGLLAILPASADASLIEVVLEDHPYQVVTRRTLDDLTQMVMSRA